ncbi:MAG: ABC transporter ATP-binding protein [Firmicutes bacterium]|nr:ABC transporter ATP-binding protein [Bacillota bacterium]
MSLTRSDKPNAADIECTEDLLLDVKDLHTQFLFDEGIVRAVDGVSFDVKRTQVLGLVGESGCGKSVTALSIMQLVPGPRGRITSGEILYYRNGERDFINIAAEHPQSPTMRSIRGNEIAMIFQEPMTSLNPVYTVGFQIAEAIVTHQKVSNTQALEIATDLLDRVGIPSPSQRVKEYPHQMSGGMRQRAMIAMALSCNPALLIADEPTTALDVTIQAQILDLMRKLQDQYQMAIIIITHNLGVVSKMCDDIAVMYMGKIIEHTDTHTLFHEPAHPYTIGLLNSIPRMGGRRRRLVPIEGVVPDSLKIPEGCAFGPRCPRFKKECLENPPVVEVADGHSVRCWLYA